MVEFLHSLDRNVVVGMGQAAVAIALCVGVVIFCRRFGVHVERETVLSLARGLVQMVAVGVVLRSTARKSADRRAYSARHDLCRRRYRVAACSRDQKKPLVLSFYAITAGSSVVIAVLLATRTVTSENCGFGPRGSMIIANAMNACAQAMERFRADITANVGLIETGLALGADPAATVAPYVQSPFTRACFPVSIMLKSLGLVWIPGVMAGMLVSGASPVYAGIFQFIVVAMILAASGIAGLVANLTYASASFSRVPRN